jgi:hypothetical protein
MATYFVVPPKRRQGIARRAQVRLRPPGLLLHLGKVAYEKFWLYRWF